MSETLKITHKVYSRQVFAEGVIKAVEFLLNKSNGLYFMKDVVK